MSDQERSLTVVCISDTHNHHRDFVPPDGDILIHAGDWTRFGAREQAEDFNNWLGSLPHRHKIYSGEWKSRAEFEAIRYDYERHFTIEFECGDRSGNPYFDMIPKNVDILIAHGPAKGFVDADCGCYSLTHHIMRTQPQLVVSGHIHKAHGVTEGEGQFKGIKFVNAAMCKDGYTIGWDAVVTTVQKH